VRAGDVDVRLRRPVTGELLEQHVLTAGDAGFSLSFETPDGNQFVVEAQYRQPAITDQSLECDHCGLWRPIVGALAGTPAETLREAVRAATEALDLAKAGGFVIPPQAAQGVALLDMTARMLAVQPADDTPPVRRDHTVTGDPVT
jgi:hypothetical protein